MVVDIRVGVAEVRVIQRIECLDAQLKILRFGVMKILEQREIEILIARPGQGISGCIAYLIGSGVSECGGIEPFTSSPRCLHDGRDLIRTEAVLVADRAIPVPAYA